MRNYKTIVHFKPFFNLDEKCRQCDVQTAAVVAASGSLAVVEVVHAAVVLLDFRSFYNKKESS